MSLMTGEKAREIKRVLNWEEEFEKTFTNGHLSGNKVYGHKETWIAARKKAHEVYMVQVEAMLVLYHLLKNELGKHIDVDKFLDEHSEETPEGFKYHEELIAKNENFETLIDQARPWVQRVQNLEPHRHDPKIESWLKITLEL